MIKKFTLAIAALIGMAGAAGFAWAEATAPAADAPEAENTPVTSTVWEDAEGVDLFTDINISGKFVKLGIKEGDKLLFTFAEVSTEAANPGLVNLCYKDAANWAETDLTAWLNIEGDTYEHVLTADDADKIKGKDWLVVKGKNAKLIKVEAMVYPKALEPLEGEFIWQGEIVFDEKWHDFELGAFRDLNYNDKLIFHFKNLTDTYAQISLCSKAGSSWEWTEFEDCNCTAIDLATMTYTYTFTKEIPTNATKPYVDVIKDHNLLIVNGKNVTLVAIEYVHDEANKEPERFATEVWTGEEALGDWNNDIKIPASAFRNAQVGDRIHFEFGAGYEGGQVQLNITVPKWTELVTGDINEDGYTYEIPDAETLANIQEGGLTVKGKVATLVRIEILSLKEPAPVLPVGEISLLENETIVDQPEAGVEVPADGLENAISISGVFGEIAEGDRIVFHYALMGDAIPQITFGTSYAADGWTWHEFRGWDDVVVNDTHTLVADVNAEMAGHLKAANSLGLNGKNFKYMAFGIIKGKPVVIPEPESTVLFEGEHEFTEWGTNNYHIDAEKFANLALNDEIVLTFTPNAGEGQYAQGNVMIGTIKLGEGENDWFEINNNPYSYTITVTASYINTLKEKGLDIDAQHAILTKAVLLHREAEEVPDAGGTAGVNHWYGEETLGNGWIHFPAEIFEKMPVGDNIVIEVTIPNSNANSSIFFGFMEKGFVNTVVNASVKEFEDFTVEKLNEGKYIIMVPNGPNIERYRNGGLYIKGSNLTVIDIQLIPENVPEGYYTSFLHSTWWTLGWEQGDVDQQHREWGKHQPGAVDDDIDNQANYFKGYQHPLYIPADRFQYVQEGDRIYVRMAWWDEQHVPEVYAYVGDLPVGNPSQARAMAQGDRIELTNDGASSRKILEINADMAEAFKAHGMTLQGQSADIDHVRLLGKAFETTGIEDLEADGADNAPAEIYTVDGRRVEAMQAGHIYIVRCGDKVEKVLAR